MRSLIDHLAAFAVELRARGVPVTLSDESDAAAALALVDVAERGEVRCALRTALKIRPAHAGIFDSVFDALWAARPAAAAISEAARQRAVPHAARRAARLLAGAGTGESSDRETPSGDTPAWSPEALLRRKPFDACTQDDLAAMERILARLAERLATRPSRRLVPVRSRGAVDPRRSFRAALATQGELVRLARRARAIEEPRIVALCDTSGSMDTHTRFLLSFLLALKNVARRTEIFVFNTALTRLTPWLRKDQTARTLERLAAAVPDWSGGTRIGECLEAFAEGYLDAMVDSRTVVLIVSDGLDRGDTAALVRAMRALSNRARRVLWLNPLLSDPRYEPTARGMAAALPFVDRLLSAHNVETLERLLPLLAA
ncbi:MAG TPA: VWA domain-containing protein [Thermoanaerobaculia bacterium]|nr:VWA domain-containing protein [Thermoanaerobaculia bacterium]